MNKITASHDKFFKKSMLDRRVSKEFFEVLLPERIKEKVDLDNLSLKNETHIDEKLKSCETDLLFSTRINGKPGYLYLLVD